MDDAEGLRRFKEAADAYVKEMTSSPAKARQALIDLGILTKTGKPRQHRGITHGPGHSVASNQPKPELRRTKAT